MKVLEILSDIKQIEKGEKENYFISDPVKITEEEFNEIYLVGYSENEIKSIKEYLNKYGVTIESNKKYNTIEELDEYVLNEFVEKNLEMKIYKYSKSKFDIEKNKAYPSVNIDKLIEEGFSEEEVRHATNKLKSNGFRVYVSSFKYDLSDLSLDIPDDFIDYEQDHYLEPFSSEEQEEKIREYLDETNEEKRRAIGNELIERNMYLVRYVIAKNNYTEKYNISMHELESIGSYGLVDFIRKYNAKTSERLKNSVFVEELKNVIKSSIENEYLKEFEDLPMNLPKSVIVDYIDARSIVEKQYQKEFIGQEDMLEDIVKIVANEDEYLSESLNEYIRKHNGLLVSYPYEDDSEVLDETIDTPDIVDNINYENIAMEEVLRDDLMDVIQTLTYREQIVIKMLFGIEDENDKRLNGKFYTRKEIGDYFGVGEARIRQIENRALLKLRHISRIKKIKPLDENHQESTFIDSIIEDVHKQI